MQVKLDLCRHSSGQMEDSTALHTLHLFCISEAEFWMYRPFRGSVGSVKNQRVPLSSWSWWNLSGTSWHRKMMPYIIFNKISRFPPHIFFIIHLDVLHEFIVHWWDLWCFTHLNDLRCVSQALRKLHLPYWCEKTLQKSFISGHKSQVSQAWVPCQTTFAGSNQRIVSSWMWSQEPSRKIEEVSKKSCGKRKLLFSNLEMPIPSVSLLWIHLCSSSRTLCFLYLAYQNLMCCATCFLSHFQKLSFRENPEIQQNNQKPGSSARDLFERSKWSAFVWSIQVTWKKLDNKLTGGKWKPPSNLCRGHRVCHNHLKRCKKPYITKGQTLPVNL